MIEIYDDNKNKFNCEILFTFDDYNKSFIVYEDEEDNILASYYKIEDDKMIITPITDDKDYDIVDKKLQEWWDDDYE